MRPSFRSVTIVRSGPRRRSLLLLPLAGAAIALCAAGAGAADADAETSADGKRVYRMSLREAEAMARRYSYDLRIARTDRDVADARIMQAYGEALPVVAADFTRARARSGQNPPSEGRWTEQYDAHLNLEQPLYKGGKVGAALKGARSYRRSVEESIRGAEQGLIFEVRVNYYGLLLQQELVRVQRGQVKMAERFLEEAIKRREAGTAAELDVLRARVELANEKAGLIRQENVQRTAEAAFLRVLGLPLDSRAELTDSLEKSSETLPEEEELARIALRERPDYRASGIGMEMQRAAIRVARSGLYPSLSLVGSYGGVNDRFDADVGDWSEDWSVGVKLEWLVFDGLSVRGQVRERQAELNRLDLLRRNLADGIRLEVRTALLNLASAREFVVSQQENVHQANTVAEQENLRFQQGTSTYLEVLDARQNLAEAEKNYYSALHDVAVARTQLLRALGTVGEEDGAAPADAPLPESEEGCDVCDGDAPPGGSAPRETVVAEDSAGPATLSEHAESAMPSSPSVEADMPEPTASEPTGESPEVPGVFTAREIVRPALRSLPPRPEAEVLETPPARVRPAEIGVQMR